MKIVRTCCTLKVTLYKRRRRRRRRRRSFD
jgi:hypothetical protein